MDDTPKEYMVDSDEEVKFDIIKSKNDDREYEYVRLSN